MSAASPKRAFSEGIEHAVERIVSERVVGDRLRVRHIGIRRFRLCDLHFLDARADSHERALEEVFRNATRRASLRRTEAWSSSSDPDV